MPEIILYAHGLLFPLWLPLCMKLNRLHMWCIQFLRLAPPPSPRRRPPAMPYLPHNISSHTSQRDHNNNSGKERRRWTSILYIFCANPLLSELSFSSTTIQLQSVCRADRSSDHRRVATTAAGTISLSLIFIGDHRSIRFNKN